MAKQYVIADYRVSISASSGGFNEWRRNIGLRTNEDGVYIDIRFVAGDPKNRPIERVREDGGSILYLSVDDFDEVLHLLQTEKPVFVTLYESANWALISTGREVPGDQELDPNA